MAASTVTLWIAHQFGDDRRMCASSGGPRSCRKCPLDLAVVEFEVDHPRFTLYSTQTVAVIETGLDRTKHPALE